MNNTHSSNPIGQGSKCSFFVDRKATLSIGDYVGMSAVAIVCAQAITIGNYVKIGGGTCIYDTDFHSLDAELRKYPDKDKSNCKTLPVFIGDNVFIGAGCLILKGVSIGCNSVVGAGSVVSKSIPNNEIWAGSPAKFIRKID